MVVGWTVVALSRVVLLVVDMVAGRVVGKGVVSGWLVVVVEDE
jgi:hypothetical protein